MSVHYDDKGKFFTDYISKDTVPVNIQTISQRIQGNVYVRPDDRLIDDLNGASHFIAVTQASVCNAQGEHLFQTEFLIVNKEYIILITPDSELIHEGEEDES